MIDRQAFRDWLAANPERVFKHTDDWTCQCPIATYARRVFPNAAMGTNTLYLNDKSGRLYDDDWLGHIVELVDTDIEQSHITAARVLELLDA